MYENLIDPQIQILERCEAAWGNMMPSLPDDLGNYVPGITKQVIQHSFLMLIERLNSLKEEPLISPFLIQAIGQNFPSWTAPLDGWITTSPANTASICSHLNAMWSTLNSHDNVRSVPNIENIQVLVKEIKRLEVLADTYVKAIVEKDNTFEDKRGNVIEQCDQIIDKATDSLAAAARAGLAKSFEIRAAEYDEPREGWLFAFILSLSAISLISFLFILPEIKEQEGSDRLYYFLTEIPLTLPFIWLAWFSALRFSQLGRLKEDYKFKVATALALDGYRKQAEDLSPALQEKLLDLAITNFGENPLRLMTKESAKDAHPLAGILDKQTLVELIKAKLQSKS